jgi:HNH endonuclease
MSSPETLWAEAFTKAQQEMPERLRSKFDMDPSGCWLWTAAVSGNGYGAYWDGVRNVPAHRAVYEFFRGPLPEPDLNLCHHCDNPLCVNPTHLFPGTQRDNIQDSLRKGRQRRNIWSTRLDVDQVIEIRHRAATGESRRRLAHEYGLAYSSMTQVINGRKWRHVPGAIK